MKLLPFLSAAFCCGVACLCSGEEPVAFSDDLSFLRKHEKVHLLKSGDARVAVVAAYQGRVMTSSYHAKAGPSLGWINREIIEAGVLPASQKLKGDPRDHIHVFGGEERFWLGPEGGQFGIYFEEGSAFEFENWKVPPALDTEPFKVTSKSSNKIVFTKRSQFKNWSGTKFDTKIWRSVRILEKSELNERFKLGIGKRVQAVAYETDNRLKNVGSEAWSRETGALSIWLLGMYPPADDAAIIIPFREGSQGEMGALVNDAYFGEISKDRLVAKNGVIVMKADGESRGKIGVLPSRSLGRAGSYDPTRRVLTLVFTAKSSEASAEYVNSMWELQEDPYAGDVINAYNDGPATPGAKPLGPFYELETSSPAALLAPGEESRHLQTTIHLTGPEKAMNRISTKFLGASLSQIESAFTPSENGK